MSKIADKHGLTNKYRPVGMGKRVVKRGRPRKHLLGLPLKKNKHYKTPKNNSIFGEDIDTQQLDVLNENPRITKLVVLLFMVIIIGIILVVCSLPKSSTNKMPIEFNISQYSETELEIEIGEYERVSFTLNPFETKDEDLEIVVSDKDVVECTFFTIAAAGKKNVAINIKGIAEGSATIYLKDKNSTSKSINIKIIVVKPNEEIDNSRTVYINFNGDKYHYSKDCAGKSAYASTLNKVKTIKEPCSKCVN